MVSSDFGFFRELTPLDFRVLSITEILMARHEIVPIDEISSYMQYTEKRTLKSLERLRNYKLLFFKQLHYLGVALSFMGYDALALKALVEKGIVSKIGPEIGAGKESNVYLAINDNGFEFLVKFHRLGKLDFRATRKARAFIAEKRHLSPLYESRLSAEREFNALNSLYLVNISVPKPIIQNRHVVAMEIITGKDLYKIKKNEFQSKEAIITLFENILHEIQAVVNQGFIHGDLSEYNIRLNENNYPVLFDWPQYVEIESEQAEMVLMRDISNILNYFKKKFQMQTNRSVSDIVMEIFKKKSD